MRIWSGWAGPSFTAPLADIKHERSVITLEISIYSLIAPLGTRLHALNRQGSVNFTYFSFDIIMSVMNSHIITTTIIIIAIMRLNRAYSTA